MRTSSWSFQCFTLATLNIRSAYYKSFAKYVLLPLACQFRCSIFTSKTCARVLLDENDRRQYLKRFRRPNLENVHRQALSKAVNAIARKVVYCPYCSATNGVVKKGGALKIIHDKFRAKKTAGELEKWKLSFTAAVESQKELAMYVNKGVHEDLNPLKVLDLFRRISNEVIPPFLHR